MPSRRRKPTTLKLRVCKLANRSNVGERLSEKSLEGSRRFGIALLKVAKWCLWVSFEHSLECRSGPFPNYQTVSPRTRVNKGKRKGQGCYAPGPRSRYVALTLRRGVGGMVS